MSVALVGLAESSQDTLDLTSRIVQEAACPVIAILETSDSELVNDAAIVLVGVGERTLPIRPLQGTASFGDL